MLNRIRTSKFLQTVLSIQIGVVLVAFIIGVLTHDMHLDTLGFWIAAEAIGMMIFGGVASGGALNNNSWNARNPNSTIVNHQLSGGYDHYKENARQAMSFQMTLLLNGIIAFGIAIMIVVVGAS